ncbi:MAG: thioredoxin domain-containing protein [Candidatus Gracilibacteria bacterium]|nr:thioredoxin domain-containing protein [Candidatus Gracilibacteria bacterium]
MRIRSLLALFVGTFFLVSCQNTNEYLYQKDNAPITSKNIDSPVFGDPNAKIQMMIFSDFQCPACIYFEKNIGNKILTDYAMTNKIGLTYKNFPLPFHKNAMDDANASMCALSEGKYKVFAEKMYALEDAKKGERVTKIERQNIAKETGLNMDNFNKCMDEGFYISKIKEDMDIGDKLGLEGTPSVYVNGKNLDFRNPDEFFKILDQLIK